MSKDLKRRIEKLERRVGVAGLETKLRAWSAGSVVTRKPISGQ